MISKIVTQDNHRLLLLLLHHYIPKNHQHESIILLQNNYCGIHIIIFTKFYFLFFEKHYNKNLSLLNQV